MSDAPINRPPPPSSRVGPCAFSENGPASRAINSVFGVPTIHSTSNAVARPAILGKHRANCEKVGPLWGDKTEV